MRVSSFCASGKAVAIDFRRRCPETSEQAGISQRMNSQMRLPEPIHSAARSRSTNLPGQRRSRDRCEIIDLVGNDSVSSRSRNLSLRVSCLCARTPGRCERRNRRPASIGRKPRIRATARARSDTSRLDLRHRHQRALFGSRCHSWRRALSMVPSKASPARSARNTSNAHKTNRRVTLID